MKSAALTSEQRQILEQRGVLSPEEIHRLATKTRTSVDEVEDGKAVCHSDYVEDADEARRLQTVGQAEPGAD